MILRISRTVPALLWTMSLSFLFPSACIMKPAQLKKEKRLKLIGLNIPFYIPPRISTGGLDNLLPADRALLPLKIDTTQAEHRAYVQEIFKKHHIKGRDDFENFYAAQCAWEDGMAQSVAENLDSDTMMVFVGNGHIKRKYGIPDRAFGRNGAPFLTIFTALPHQPVSLKDGDFIWVTDAPRRP